MYSSSQKFIHLGVHDVGTLHHSGVPAVLVEGERLGFTVGVEADPLPKQTKTKSVNQP